MSDKPRPERMWILRNRGDNYMWVETDEAKAHTRRVASFDVFEVAAIEKEVSGRPPERETSGESERPTRVLVSGVWEPLCYCVEPIESEGRGKGKPGCTFCGGLLTLPKTTRAEPYTPGQDGTAPQPDGIRESVLAFAWAMEERLRKYDDERGKRGWMTSDPGDLFERLLEEAEELRAVLAIEYVEFPPWTRYREEAADVANFAMMIADTTGSLLPVVARRKRAPLPSALPEEFVRRQIAEPSEDAPCAPVPQEADQTAQLADMPHDRTDHVSETIGSAPRTGSGPK